jgi:hypothetical protein
MASMPDLPPQEARQPWDIKPIDIVARHRLQSLNLGNQGWRQELIRIQMQLPIVLERKVINRPIALVAVVDEWVLDNSRSVRHGNLQGVITAVRVDDMNVVGHSLRALQRLPDRKLGIER